MSEISEEEVRSVMAAIADIDIRSEFDPCRLSSWISALFTHDYPTPQERQQADEWAGEAVEKIARAAIEAYLSVSSAYRKGEEDMRERAAALADDDLWATRELSQAIRALPATGEK